MLTGLLLHLCNRDNQFKQMDSVKSFLTIALVGAICVVGMGIALLITEEFSGDSAPVLEQIVKQNEDGFSSETSEESAISSAATGKTTVAMFPYQLNCFGVKASIFGVERTFMVDTGCSYSMINKATYEALKEKGMMNEIKLYKEELQMADNSITTMQWFYASFKIGDTTVSNAKCFIVNDRTAKNILGMTALKGCVIDFNKETLSFN